MRLVHLQMPRPELLEAPIDSEGMQVEYARCKTCISGGGTER